MSAASQVVRDGGAIIIATACEDGLPDHGLYAELLVEAGSPQGILEMISKPGFSVQDQWQVQVQAQIQLHADVYVYSDGLSDDQIRQALFLPCQDVEATLERLQASLGSQVRICVMPEGPQLIPYLSAG
jgi:nickel-dependent lactate racemase